MQNILDRIQNKGKWFFDRYLWRDPVVCGVGTWYQVSPSQGLLFDHRLPAKPVIFDVGGFTGEWAEPMYRRYGGSLHVFEPLEAYVTTLKKRFRGQRGVRIHPFGLAASDGTALFSLQGQGSSAFREGGPGQKVRLRAVNKVMAGLAPQGVDLMAINAEGAEYELLEAMLRGKTIGKVGVLLVQFHPLVKNYRRRYRALTEGLSKTHELVFRVPFVWEKWVRKA